MKNSKPSYFEIDPKEQIEILQYYSNELSMRDTILEKDIWLCKVLQIIFNIPNRHPMAFKGGTSLSKVFNVIDRFSEDVDITLDYSAFNIVDLNASKSQIKKMAQELKVRVKEYRDNIIVPELKEKLPHCDIVVDDSGEKILVQYPSVLQSNEPYIKEAVLIELGGRNKINPNDIYTVKPYIAEHNELISFPESEIVVLSPKRTFWEKATLIHVECHRGLKQNAERLSRHWYDLTKLYEHGIGKDAINDMALLEDVVNHKSIFFNASYAHYDDCLNKRFKLIPDDLTTLETDYRKMCNSGMISQKDPLSFKEMMKIIEQISKCINQD
ncbi:MAG: nucleotidyl transferase AbiEii/AbiGii toxin family protein [Pasteurella sp.]|nr:nucleotidyl transferase AbiEii/AbiGii toxin family protein [Pasteurella sp.]